MKAEVIDTAAEIAGEYGHDVEEALSRWEEAGAERGGRKANVLLSVAFLFARHLRTTIGRG